MKKQPIHCKRFLFRHNIRSDHADLPVTIHQLQQRQEEYAAAANAFDIVSPMAPPVSGYQGVTSPATPSPHGSNTLSPPQQQQQQQRQTSGGSSLAAAAASSTPSASGGAAGGRRRTLAMGTHGDILEKHHQVSWTFKSQC